MQINKQGNCLVQLNTIFCLQEMRLNVFKICFLFHLLIAHYLSVKELSAVLVVPLNTRPDGITECGDYQPEQLVANTEPVPWCLSVSKR